MTNWLNNMKGFTLVEVLASIVIISAIVIVSISFFIQSQQTTNTASDMTNATYIVQEEIEYIQYLSREYGYIDAIDKLKDDPLFQYVPSQATHTFEKQNQSFLVNIQISSRSAASNLKNIMIKTYDADSHLRAQMETKIEWE